MNEKIKIKTPVTCEAWQTLTRIVIIASLSTSSIKVAWIGGTMLACYSDNTCRKMSNINVEWLKISLLREL